MHRHINPRHARRRQPARVGAVLVAFALLPVGLAVAGPDFGDWSPAQKIDDINGNDLAVNSDLTDGCPIQSPDGLSLYMASNRAGGKGGLDIWVATRRHRNDPFGAPQSLPEPINSAVNDYCPTPIEGGTLFFVSNRAIEGACGLGDIFVARRNPARGWSEPEHLACEADGGPNSGLDEQGPSYVQGQLYFSRSATAAQTTPAVPGALFVSVKRDSGFGPASEIVELASPANDIQPNVRKDGREMVFSSNRSGPATGQDIWSSTRASIDDEWSPPVKLGAAVNTVYNETRPSLSSDAQQLLFGRAGPVGTGEGGQGAADIYVTTRSMGGG